MHHSTYFAISSQVSQTEGSVMLLDYAASRRPEGWSGPVTLIGDAVHNMPPTGGEGANMALRDAATLCREAPATLGGDWHDALSRYRERMLVYAFEAVDRSMVNMRRMVERRA